MSQTPRRTRQRPHSRGEKIARIFVRQYSTWEAIEVLLSLYQQEAGKTAQYSGRGTLEGLKYVTLGLVGEAGEVANKVKKINRDHGNILTQEMKEAISKELGDVLWYVSQVAHELDIPLSDIGYQNLQMLHKRQLVDKIKGSGDNR